MGTGRKPVAAITYASPDLIPPELRRIAAVSVMDGLQLVGFVDYDVAWFMPGNTLPPNYQLVGAVIYGPSDSIPADMLRVNAILSIPASGVTPPANSLGGAPVPMLKTGQTTQYSSELDDGYYEKGVAKSYTPLTTGQYSLTTNIDLAHYTATAGQIAFDNVAKTITDVGNGLAIFKTGDVITTDAPNNPGPFTVTTGNVAGTITCTGATFVTETPAGAITIKKREAHSNACVLDINTGLMWSRTVPDKMGAASNGLMEWTGVAYDIFAYCAAANTAALAGYSDWRVCNKKEQESLMVDETNPVAPDSTAFPSFPAAKVWNSTTDKNDTNSGSVYNGDSIGQISRATKVTACYCHLVRGG